MSSSATFTPEEVAEFLQPYLPYLDTKKRRQANPPGEVG